MMAERRPHRSSPTPAGISSPVPDSPLPLESSPPNKSSSGGTTTHQSGSEIPLIGKGNTTSATAPFSRDEEHRLERLRTKRKQKAEASLSADEMVELSILEDKYNAFVAEGLERMKAMSRSELNRNNHSGSSRGRELLASSGKRVVEGAKQLFSSVKRRIVRRSNPSAVSTPLPAPSAAREGHLSDTRFHRAFSRVFRNTTGGGGGGNRTLLRTAILVTAIGFATLLTVLAYDSNTVKTHDGLSLRGRSNPNNGNKDAPADRDQQQQKKPPLGEETLGETDAGGAVDPLEEILHTPAVLDEAPPVIGGTGPKPIQTENKNNSPPPNPKTTLTDFVRENISHRLHYVAHFAQYFLALGVAICLITSRGSNLGGGGTDNSVAPAATTTPLLTPTNEDASLGHKSVPGNINLVSAPQSSLPSSSVASSLAPTSGGSTATATATVVFSLKTKIFLVAPLILLSASNTIHLRECAIVELKAIIIDRAGVLFPESLCVLFGAADLFLFFASIYIFLWGDSK